MTLDFWKILDMGALVGAAVVVLALTRPVRVVFTDCDGTMLNPDHTLSHTTQATLLELKRRNVRVVPATGRAYAGAWVRDVLTHPALSHGQPGIFQNGCVAYDTDGPLPPSALHNTVAQMVLSLARQQGSCAVAYVENEALYESTSPLIQRLADVGDAPLRRVRCLPSACMDVDVTKVLLLTNDDDASLLDLRKIYGAEIGANAGLTSALPWMLEVMPRGVSKATAAAALLERWNIPADEALAIGDGENDLTLLDYVGTSVAMSNGVREVRESADYVVPSNANEGWSEAMERYVLSSYG